MSCAQFAGPGWVQGGGDKTKEGLAHLSGRPPLDSRRLSLRSSPRSSASSASYMSYSSIVICCPWCVFDGGQLRRLGSWQGRPDPEGRGRAPTSPCLPLPRAVARPDVLAAGSRAPPVGCCCLGLERNSKEFKGNFGFEAKIPEARQMKRPSPSERFFEVASQKRERRGAEPEEERTNEREK